MRRLTRKEYEAIETALNQVLAGECIDGLEGEPEEPKVLAAMERALAKVQERL